MVGDSVLRRLARPSEKVTVDESIFGEITLSMPEHALWLAVIERAMMDYLGMWASLPRPSKASLNEFFFDTQARPNNLQYICDNLFDFPDAAKMIRERVVSLASGIETAPLRTSGTTRYVSKLKGKRSISSFSSQ